MHPVRKVLGSVCDHCPLCNYAREHPDTLLGRWYEWHGKWCPLWRAQKEIAAAREKPASSQGVKPKPGQ